MEDYEDDIEIWLSGSEEPIKAYTNTPDQFFDFVTNLGHGADIVAFPGFDDEDGEHLCVNAEEVDFVIAPKELVTTGEETVIQEDGLYEPPPK